jgi:hypothetical protein
VYGSKGVEFADFCCLLNFQRCKRADITGDRVVDGADLNRLLSSWGDCSGGDCSGDLDGNDVIDGADLNILLASWGSCT